MRGLCRGPGRRWRRAGPGPGLRRVVSGCRRGVLGPASTGPGQLRSIQRWARLPARPFMRQHCFQKVSVISLNDEHLFPKCVKDHFPVRIETEAYQRLQTLKELLRHKLWFTWLWGCAEAMSMDHIIQIFNWVACLRPMSLLFEGIGGRGLRWRDL